MNLGTFSLSLCVSDLQRSREFYEKLGFETLGDYSDQGWMMMRSPTLTLGLFEKFIEKNTLTFNPGWDQQGGELGSFTDVREIQRSLREAGIEIAVAADESARSTSSSSTRTATRSSSISTADRQRR